MKTSRANVHSNNSQSQSFRLHHISKANSTRKSSQTFYNPDDTFKLAALNSVTRGVKHADLSFMTGTNLNKLRVEPIEPNEGQYLSAHDNLTEVRLRYDDIRKQRVQLEDKISRMKKQENTLFLKESTNIKLDRQAKKQEKKSLLETTATEKKVLLNLEYRHKSDKVFYDQKKFDLQQLLALKQKQLAIYRREGHTVIEGEDRTGKVYERLEQEIQRERQERAEHIRNLETMIEERLQLQVVNQERQADLNQIAERAMQDKDQNQKQWRQILLTHIYLNKLLSDKIEKQMQKFHIVQFAFKEIKTATGVTDAKTLISKYLNKQAQYGGLLSKIADNQKSIQNLKTESDQLIEESKHLQMQREVLQSIKIKSQDLHDSLIELDIIDRKASTSQNYQHKLAIWVNLQLKKLIGKKHMDQGPSNPQTLSGSITKYLKILTSELQSMEEVQVNDEALGQGLGQKENERNLRVIPKRSRRNSIGQQIFDVDEEELAPRTNEQQAEVVNNMHEQIIRQNEKFMKEVKRRVFEEKKLLMEKKESKPKQGPKVAEAPKNDQ